MAQARTPRVRREPPRFRRVEVRGIEPLSPCLTRVTLAGDELADFAVPEPAASVRLLLPPPGSRQLVMPAWNGNEFLLPDGRRAVIRTFTPRRFDAAAHELDLDVVIHDEGVASAWVRGAAPGDTAAVSGPGRGYTIDTDAPAFLLGGDETAIPAISQLLEVLPTTAPVRVRIEVARADARLALPSRPDLTFEWLDLPPGAPPGDALVDALAALDVADDTRIWVAGEAAAVQRVRRHLFEERGISRSRTSIRGYWKAGRSGDADDE
ncbi:MAG TPA: siderophore-interacting protein [Acidimicrobiia bacterium]|jgi:NADPH-dependent ferric siderophore reductase